MSLSRPIANELDWNIAGNTVPKTIFASKGREPDLDLFDQSAGIGLILPDTCRSYVLSAKQEACRDGRNSNPARGQVVRRCRSAS
jgi:hypothetical protein